jgi:chromosome partitioning protein
MSLTAWFQVREAARGDAAAGLLVNQIKGWRVRAEVDKLAGAHDIVLIDSPPHMETEARVAIRAADLVIVPVQPSPMDVWATKPTMDLAHEEKSPVMLVLNRVPPRAKLTDAMQAEIDALGAEQAEAQIGNRVVFASALSEGRAVGEVSPTGKAAQEIKALAKELLTRVGA